MPTPEHIGRAGEAFGGVDIERSTKTSASVARWLATQIIENGSLPGTPLPPERDLAESFSIGRGTMREALRILETFGLIEMRTGRYGGPVVKAPDARDLNVSLTLAFYANGSSMFDVLKARMVIEPALAEMAARRITSEQLDQLRETIDVLRRPDASQADYFRATERFHDVVLTHAADSSVLSQISAGLQRIGGGEIVGMSYMSRQRLATASAHAAIVDALHARDAELSHRLWKQHLEEAAAYWQREFPESASKRIEWTIGLPSQR